MPACNPSDRSPPFTEQGRSPGGGGAPTFPGRWPFAFRSLTITGFIQTRAELGGSGGAIIKEQIDRASGAWEEAKRKIAEDANRKRSEAAREQHEVSTPRHGETMVSVPKEHAPKQEPRPTRAAKAEAAHVSPSTQAKAEWIVNKRPDLA